MESFSDAKTFDGSNNSASLDDRVVFGLSICLVVIGILGIFCNAMILTIYYKYPRLRTATNLFILNLAFCNLLLAKLQIIFSTPSYFGKRWLYGHGGCIAYGFLHQYFMSVAVATLTVIAFDRFCVITKPVRKSQHFVVTKTRARWLILGTHVYSFVFTSPLLGWNKLVHDNFHTGCYINYADRRPSSLAYTVTFTVFTCVLPLIMTTCFYMRIYKSVRNSSRRSTLHRRKPTTAYKEAATLRSSCRRKSLYYTRTARMIFIVMFFFLLTWLPIKVMGFLHAFGCDVQPLPAYVSVFIAKCCVLYNAVVYVFLNHRFRAAFLHLAFIYRGNGKLRLATSATNVSGRFADIRGSVTENCERSKTLSRNNLGHLSFIAADDFPEISLTSEKSSADDPSFVDYTQYSEAFSKPLSENGDHTLRTTIKISSTDEALINKASRGRENGSVMVGNKLETGRLADVFRANSSVTSYGFNNPGLSFELEHSNPDEDNSDPACNYLELDVKALRERKHGEIV